jgi:hypothetical protein
MKSRFPSPTYRQPLKPMKPLQPLRPLPPAPNLIQQPTGQRTMNVPGAPLLPPNPLLERMRIMMGRRK